MTDVKISAPNTQNTTVAVTTAHGVAITVPAGPDIAISVGAGNVVGIAVSAPAPIQITATQTLLQVGIDVTVVSPVGIVVGGSGSGSEDEIHSANAYPLSGQRAVIYDSFTDGWIYADRTNPAHMNAAIAITLGAIDLSYAGFGRYKGIIVEPSWNWPAPCSIWLDANGYLTSVAPTSGFLKLLGQAISSTKVDWDPQLVINLYSVPFDYGTDFSDSRNSQYAGAVSAFAA